MQFIGVDFGTSNSLASLHRNNQIEFVNFPDNNTSNPTVLYFPIRSKEYYIGNDAIHRYLSHLDDNEIGGRLMLSIKSLLPEANFDHTTVAGFGRQTPEDLVAKFLSIIKQLAERQFAAKFDGVVLGRPVHFNELAVNRLEKAAKIAGFKEVVFWLEPVAAGLAYEISSNKDELVCVVDIGGGTSDICIIETSQARSLLSDRLNDIKAVNGVNEAGDELSSQIMKHKLAPKFGAGSSFTSLGKIMPFPSHIIYKLSRWHLINLLKTGGYISTISSIYPSSNRPEDVKRLLDLIKHHYGFELFQAIDAAKKHLSGNDSAVIKFRPLELSEEISLDEFEDIIIDIVKKIEEAILGTLRLASVEPEDINRVILTGGSSQVPAINQSVVKIFGEEKILRPDFFSSVATGLGHVASRLNNLVSEKR